MPLRPVHCWARSRVKPMIAALLAAYAACGSAAVVCPNTLPMLTIELPGFITRPQACAIQYEPFRLMSITCRNCSGAVPAGDRHQPERLILDGAGLWPGDEAGQL